MNGMIKTEKAIRRPMHRVDNEQGSVLVISMLILVMLTLVGFASMNTSNIEMMISGNERTYKENFYRAEAANMAGGQRYDNLADSGGSGGGMDFGSAGPGVSETSTLSLMGAVGWVSSTDLPDDPFNAAGSGQALDADSRYHILYLGTTEGSSEGLESPTTFYRYSVYGQSDIKGGNVMIQTGGSVNF